MPTCWWCGRPDLGGPGLTLADAMRAALANAAVLVLSGGVSVGERDYVKPALAALGVEADFWKAFPKMPAAEFARFAALAPPPSAS
jgi:hypothetical protein